MKTVLITGASRGIGRAVALSFAEAGYSMLITCSKQEEALLELAHTIEETYKVKCLTFVGSVSDPDNVREMYGLVRKEFKKLDVAVNNAGISKVGLFTDVTDSDWEEICGVNLSGMIYSCREASRIMVDQKHGKIFNISSMWGQVGASCEVLYSATKGGIDALTKALAKELAPSNVQVNAIAPGVIDTDMNKCFSEDERAALSDEIPAGRFGRPEEVAKLILSLSEGHEYLTGQVIRLDGGMI